MACQFQSNLIDILLVEDNPGDVRITREVLKDGKLRNNLFVCGDGEEALDFLRQRGKHANAVHPDLVLLDRPKQRGFPRGRPGSRRAFTLVPPENDIRG
jgi:two-component system, chemotaxis family, response regulator Rcp1